MKMCLLIGEGSDGNRVFSNDSHKIVKIAIHWEKEIVSFPRFSCMTLVFVFTWTIAEKIPNSE